MLAPDVAAGAIRKGDSAVEALLKVDPPTVFGGKIRGGGGGMEQVAAALSERGEGDLHLAFRERFMPHQLDMLAGIERKEGPIELSLDVSDTEAISWDAAGRSPQWQKLLENPSLSVTKLNISGCNVEDGPSPNTYLTPIAQCKTLRSVAMRHLGEEMEHADEFRSALEELLSNDSLTELDITHNFLGERYKGVLGALRNPNLVDLHASWNGIGPDIGFLNNLTGLRILHLGRNDLGSEGGSVIANFLMQTDARIEVLELNDNNMRGAVNEVVKAVGTKHGEWVTKVGLHGNGATDKSIADVQRMVAACSNLTELDVSGNVYTRFLTNAECGEVKVNLSGNPLRPTYDVFSLLWNPRVNLFESVPADIRKIVLSANYQQPTKLGDATGPLVVEEQWYASVGAVDPRRRDRDLTLLDACKMYPHLECPIVPWTRRTKRKEQLPEGPCSIMAFSEEGIRRLLHAIKVQTREVALLRSGFIDSKGLSTLRVDLK